MFHYIYLRRVDDELVITKRVSRPVEIPEDERITDPDLGYGDAVWPIERGMETLIDEDRRVYVEAVDREAIKAEIDRQAEEVRLQFVTPGAGQALVYQQKLYEAQTLEPPFDPEDYPMLAAELGITGETLEEVAGVVLAIANQWKAMAAAIETARLGAKKAVDDATTLEELDAAASVTWP